jgi:hypothetical protein
MTAQERLRVAYADHGLRWIVPVPARRHGTHLHRRCSFIPVAQKPLEDTERRTAQAMDAWR